MAATKRYINATVAFTPSGGSSTPATGLTSYNFPANIELQKFDGDADKFTTTLAQTHADPVLTVTVADIFALTSVAYGTRGTVVLTVSDAKNGVTTSGGGRTITGSNVVIGADDPTGSHRQFASNTYSFHGESTDGVTSPWAVAAL